MISEYSTHPTETCHAQSRAQRNYALINVIIMTIRQGLHLQPVLEIAG